MQPLRYSINVTMDGCVDHRAGIPSEAIHRYATEWIASADTLLFGRVTYEMMESAWRNPAPGTPEWMLPFARTISAARKYVVSRTMQEVDWNAELVTGDLAETVRRLKSENGRGIATGGVTLPTQLAELDLIDEYAFVMHPRVAGHGPRLFEGLSRIVDLTLVGQEELGDGIVVMRYVPRAGGAR